MHLHPIGGFNLKTSGLDFGYPTVHFYSEKGLSIRERLITQTKEMSVGVLALQGAFHEHIVALGKLGVKAVEVRKPEQLEGLLGLIIPGGESTTMAKLAHHYNFFQALRDFSKRGRPIWGTCAGLIFLANNVVGQKKGGQEFLGGLDCTVHRNFFGNQLNSFETELPVPALVAKEGGPQTFRAVFIRAPAILKADPSVEVLADYTIPSENKENSFAGEKVIVAVKQGNFLGTAFHPELTSDTRWHSLFLKMLEENGSINLSQTELKQDAKIANLPSPVRDLPVFQETQGSSFER